MAKKALIFCKRECVRRAKRTPCTLVLLNESIDGIRKRIITDTVTYSLPQVYLISSNNFKLSYHVRAAVISANDTVKQ